MMKPGRSKGQQRPGHHHVGGSPGDEILYGVNPVLEALRAGKRKIRSVTMKRGAAGTKQMGTIADLCARRNIPLEQADIDAVARLAGTEGHQGIAARCSGPVYSTFDKVLDRLDPATGPRVAVLDNVQDPRNLGAVIRSAEAFGFAALCFPERRAASYTPVAAKSSAGAGEHLPLCRVVNTAETVGALRDAGFFCVAFEGDGTEELRGPLPGGPVAIVLGGEGTGVRPVVRKRCDAVYRIPMTGRVGSLNVSAAAAVAFYAACLGKP